MIPLEEARRFVLGACRPLEPVRAALPDACGLVTAETVIAGEAIPAFDNTAVDGFAVRAADTAGAAPDAPRRLAVVGLIAAGADLDLEVGPGQAARIMTGAPLPPGADAVVMVEVTRSAEDHVDVLEPVASGAAVRRAGDDLRPGESVFGPGEALSPGHLGVLASLGRYEVLAYRRPRVGVLSTGDELVDGPAPLARGQIRDSNRHTLLAMCGEAGFDAVDLGLVRDDEALITDALLAGAASCDALITSGGVSMGDFDYIKVVLDKIGDMRWMQVAIRPAKPLAFGTVEGTPVFGLPGNPVSSMVSFELFARPGLRQMMGLPPHKLDRPLVWAVSPDGLPRSPDGKTHFDRVVVTYGEAGYEVRSAGGQGSHQLFAMAKADGLAVAPDGPGIAPGGRVQVMLLRPNP
ncbi:MAG: gephyrin-like molybdotransferase Glp [Acidimicrobiales bacterium]